MERDVTGQRVVVVGAARSGVAAAELLARHGARVTLADLKRDFPEAAQLREAGVALELGLHDSRLFAAADLLVLSPGVPWRERAVAYARRKKVPVIGEIELAASMLRGRIIAITGTKGKVDNDDARRPDARGGRLPRAGLGEHRRAAECAGRLVDRRHDSRGGGEQLSARVDVHVPSVDRGVAESVGRPPGSPRESARVHGGQGPGVRQPDGWRLDGRQCRGTSRRSASSRKGPRRPSGCSDWTRPSRTGTVVADGWIVERNAGCDPLPILPISDVKLIGRHLLADVVAATTIARLTGAPADAIRRAVVGFKGLEHALEEVATIGGVRFFKRFEGDEHRIGAARDRELRPVSRTDSRRQVQGRRLPRPAVGVEGAVVGGHCDRRGETGDSGSVGRHAGRCRDGLDGRSRASGPGRDARRRHRGAGARVRELRHVPRLRGAWAGLQAGSHETGGGVPRIS